MFFAESWIFLPFVPVPFALAITFWTSVFDRWVSELNFCATQVDNQLPSALFPALMRSRSLPPPKRLPDGTKAPVGIIQLDGLEPRPADR